MSERGRYWQRNLGEGNIGYHDLRTIFESAMRREEKDSSGKPYEYYLDKDARHKLIQVRNIRDKEVRRQTQTTRKKRFGLF